MRRFQIIVFLVLLAFVLSLNGFPITSTPSVRASNVSAETTVVVTADTLNVRAGPGTSYKVVAQVKRGTVLTVLERSQLGDWLKVRTPAQIVGWVSARYVAPGPATGGPSSSQTSPPRSSGVPATTLPSYAGQSFRPNTTVASGCQIYECFGAGDTPLREVSAGTPVQVVGVGDFVPPSEYADRLGSGKFAKVRIWDGQYAWMLAAFLPIDPAGQPTVSNRCEDWDRIDWAKVVRPTPVPQNLYSSPGSGSPTRSGCCKVCSAGKACGNTCISRSKNCHVGPGCACNG